MDIVYLVKECAVNDELTYSLRSLKNIAHGKVFLVGGCPFNINKDKIINVPVLQTNNKYKNTTSNLQLICHNKNLSEDFILMNDDFFILSPIKEEDLNLCRGPIEKVLQDYISRYGENNSVYIQGMKQTKVLLEDLGINKPLSYELHIPMVINKNKFLDIFSLPHIQSISVLHKRTVYGNLYCKDSKEINDVKVLNDYWYPLGSDKFLSTEDNSFRKVKHYLDKLFPEKSEFEI